MKKNCLIIICAFLANSVIAQTIQLDRYSTLALDQSDLHKTPLDVLVHISFPRNAVKTVSDAVQYVLLRTGYTLKDSTDATVNTVFSKRLPESHRDIGTSTVNQVLQMLLGDSFILKIDHASRTISYEALAENSTSKTELNNGAK